MVPVAHTINLKFGYLIATIIVKKYVCKICPAIELKKDEFLGNI